MEFLVPDGIRNTYERTPAGVLLIKVDMLTKDTIDFGGGDIRCEHLVGTILEPQEVAGQKFEHNFVIGTDNDPLAAAPQTWVERASRLKECCTAAGVTLEGRDIALARAELRGRKVLVRTSWVLGKKAYLNVRVDKWFAVGTPGVIPYLDTDHMTRLIALRDRMRDAQGTMIGAENGQRAAPVTGVSTPRPPVPPVPMYRSGRREQT